MDNYINASASPDGELVKEVHAYFGLCMYFAQVFETELINTLTALETATDEKPFRQTYDMYYAKHEALTFGNLVRGLIRHNFFPSALIEEINALKADRDHLAHRFFRDHDLNFMTVGGCYIMIEELETRRKKFMDVDRRISELGTRAFEKLGFDTETLRKETDKIKEEMIREAQARYSSAAGTVRGGSRT
ncbi:MAG TPA: hypothetical protein VII56_08760 [Rhizomicrobium sp.]